MDGRVGVRLFPKHKKEMPKWKCTKGPMSPLFQIKGLAITMVWSTPQATLNASAGSDKGTG